MNVKIWPKFCNRQHFWQNFPKNVCMEFEMLLHILGSHIQNLPLLKSSFSHPEKECFHTLRKFNVTSNISEWCDIKTNCCAPEDFLLLAFWKEKSIQALASLGRTPGRVGPRVVTACFTATYLCRGHPRGPVHSPGGSYPLLYWWGPPASGLGSPFCDFW